MISRFFLTFFILIRSCQTDNTARRVTAQAIIKSQKDVIETRRAEGIDFFATGSNPSWSLDIDAERWIRFGAFEEPPSLSTSVPSPVIDTVTSTAVYSAANISGRLTVTISNQRCVDTLSGIEYLFAVEVEALGKTYSGCGTLIGKFQLAPEQGDPIRLNDIWLLRSLRDSTIDVHTLRYAPMLEPHLADSTVFGNTGCNQLRGDVVVTEREIRFGNLVTTEMACPGGIDREFLAALSAVNSFAFRGLRLYLLRNGEILMVLRKVD
jgi:uncharacterized membrane protein